MAPMSNRLLVPRKTPGLLDLVPGAAAAYSLRSLSRSYADPVVTVRRSSDDAEDSFTAAEVADGTLAAFCGAGDGLVTKWWDQSGNARHASQTTPERQPKIVSSGVVVTEEGKPAIQFDGTNDSLVTSSFAYKKQTAFFTVAKATAVTTTTNLFRHQGNVTSEIFHRFDTALGVPTLRSFRKGSSGTYSVATPAIVGSQYLLCSLFSELSVQQYANGAATGAAAATPFDQNSTATYSVGGYLNSEPFNGTISETIAYESVDLTSQRELIEGNIAWGYSV